jgi:pyruvate carboxylase subunit B
VEEIPKKQAAVQAQPNTPSSMEVEVDGEVFSVRILSVGGSKVEVVSTTSQKIPRGDVAGGIKSNMQGMVLKILINRGSAVKKVISLSCLKR